MASPVKMGPLYPLKEEFLASNWCSFEEDVMYPGIKLEMPIICISLPQNGNLLGFQHRAQQVSNLKSFLI